MTLITVDAAAITRLGQAFAAAGKSGPVALRQAVTRARDQALTQMVRAETAQTGLKRKVIVRALRKQRHDEIISRGGSIRLKYFSPRETRKGVSAAPWGVRRVYLGTFMKGGRFPKRVPLNMGGHVFRRTDSSRLPIVGTRSGLFIPVEMTTGATAQAFYATVERVLPERMMHELLRRLPG